MKVFIVTPSRYEWEIIATAVVLSESKEEAIEMAEKKFLKSQRPLEAEEVPFDKGVIYEDIRYS